MCAVWCGALWSATHEISPLKQRQAIAVWPLALETLGGRKVAEEGKGSPTKYNLRWIWAVVRVTNKNGFQREEAGERRRGCS